MAIEMFILMYNMGNIILLCWKIGMYVKTTMIFKAMKDVNRVFILMVYINYLLIRNKT